MIEYVCRECDTVCKNAPGIGHYCPNEDCSVLDGHLGSPWKRYKYLSVDKSGNVKEEL